MIDISPLIEGIKRRHEKLEANRGSDELFRSLVEADESYKSYLEPVVAIAARAHVDRGVLLKELEKVMAELRGGND